MGATETREKILSTTMELIKERNGDIGNVTIRMIADRAEIGVGLTNHYFKSKDILISECVNLVFKDIYSAFLPDSNLPANASPMETTKRAARKVMDFLLTNEAVARVAMLTEVAAPSLEDHTTRIINSFAYCMVDRKKLEDMLSNDRMSEKMKQQFREHFVSEQRIKAFMITSAIKQAFMRKDMLVDTIGVDLSDSEQREEYTDELIEMLM